MKTLSNPQDTREVLDRLNRLSADSKRQWGRMTANQMICHLSDSFKAPTGEKFASPASNFLYRTIIKWIALQTEIKWSHGAKTRPEMDQQVGGTRPVDFASDRKRLEDQVK